MSLIHDALKKAQKEQRERIGSGVSGLQESIGDERPPINKRTVVLAIILVGALGAFAYLRLFSPSTRTEAPPPRPAAADAAPVAGDPAMLKRRAYDSFRGGDISGAWANISAAVRLAPEDAEAWNNKGMIAKSRGDLSQARASYAKAIELKPDYAEAMNNLAVIEMDQGNPGAARELLNKALGFQPAYPEANFNMALIYDQAGDKARAKDYYRRFLDVGGGFPSNVVERVRDRMMELDR